MIFGVPDEDWDFSDLQVPSPRQDRDDEMFTCDDEGMTEKLEDIAWPKGLPWVVEQTIASEAPVQVEDPDDDLERELAFYNMVSCRICRLKLSSTESYQLDSVVAEGVKHKCRPLKPNVDEFNKLFSRL